MPKAIVSVPFKLAELIYEQHQAGVDHVTIAAANGTNESVIRAIVQMQKRKAKTRVKPEKEPA